MSGTGTPTIETKCYSDGTIATGVAPLPEMSPAQQDRKTIEDKRVEPPIELAHHELHWLRCGRYFDVAEWCGTHWKMMGQDGQVSPEYLYSRAHRYVGPALPPGDKL